MKSLSFTHRTLLHRNGKKTPTVSICTHWAACCCGFERTCWWRWCWFWSVPDTDSVLGTTLRPTAWSVSAERHEHTPTRQNLQRPSQPHLEVDHFCFVLQDFSCFSIFLLCHSLNRIYSSWLRPDVLKHFGRCVSYADEGGRTKPSQA